MDFMFRDTVSFKHKLCGPAWVYSTATKSAMFSGSSGSISWTVCPFSPQSKRQLQSAIDACLKLSSKGDCPKGPNGQIGEWDVSRVTDLSRLFSNAKLFDGDISKYDMFNGDISKWDVSNVKSMYGTFWDATAFNGDISKWDLSSVRDTYGMFTNALSFKGDISEWDVSSVTNMAYMFSNAAEFNGDI